MPGIPATGGEGHTGAKFLASGGLGLITAFGKIGTTTANASVTLVGPKSIAVGDKIMCATAVRFSTTAASIKTVGNLTTACVFLSSGKVKLTGSVNTFSGGLLLVSYVDLTN